MSSTESLAAVRSPEAAITPPVPVAWEARVAVAAHRWPRAQSWPKSMSWPSHPSPLYPTRRLLGALIPLGLPLGELPLNRISSLQNSNRNPSSLNHSHSNLNSSSPNLSHSSLNSRKPSSLSNSSPNRTHRPFSLRRRHSSRSHLTARHRPSNWSHLATHPHLSSLALRLARPLLPLLGRPLKPLNQLISSVSPTSSLRPSSLAINSSLLLSNNPVLLNSSQSRSTHHSTHKNLLQCLPLALPRLNSHHHIRYRPGSSLPWPPFSLVR